MITCSDAVRRLWDYLDRVLEPVDVQALEEHMSFCRQCCGELEFARELQRFLAAPPAAGLPDDVHDRLERFLDTLDDAEG